RDLIVTGVQTCALPIFRPSPPACVPEDRAKGLWVPPTNAAHLPFATGNHSAGDGRHVFAPRTSHGQLIQFQPGRPRMARGCVLRSEERRVGIEWSVCLS